MILESRNCAILDCLLHATYTSYFYCEIMILIYLLTVVGLSPGGSTHLHTNNT